MIITQSNITHHSILYTLKWRPMSAMSVSNHRQIDWQAVITENIKPLCLWPFVGDPVDSPHEWPVMRKVFSSHDVIMSNEICELFIKLWTHKDTPNATLDKSMFWRVTALGRPRSVYKSDVECRFLKFWVEMAKCPWRSRSITPIFNTSCGNSKMHICCKFGDCSSKPMQVTHGKAKFLSQDGQKTSKVKVNDLHFQYQLRVSQDARLVQIWWL